jgi:hypothetical protein
MVFNSEFRHAAIGDGILQAFNQESSKELFDIIDDYKNHNDYLRLKNELNELGHRLKKPKKEVFSSIDQMI